MIIDLWLAVVGLLRVDSGRWSFKWDGQMADGYKANKGSYEIRYKAAGVTTAQPLKLLHTR